MNKQQRRQAMNQALKSKSFYDLMQAYRHAPITQQYETSNAYLAVIDYILDSAENLAPPNVGQVEVTQHE